MVDFGTPFEIRWGQKWHQNQPSGATNHKKSRRVSSKTKLLGRPCSSKPARSAQYIIFPDLGQISAPCSPILDPALMISSLFLIRSLQLTERQAIATSNQELQKTFWKLNNETRCNPSDMAPPKMIFSQWQDVQQISIADLWRFYNIIGRINEPSVAPKDSRG